MLHDADPVEDIANTKKIALIIIGGKVLTRVTLDKMLAEVETLAGKKQSGPFRTAP